MKIGGALLSRSQTKQFALQQIHMNKINLREKFSLIKDHWQPHIAGELNGQYVKLGKFKGAFHLASSRERRRVVSGREGKISNGVSRQLRPGTINLDRTG